MIMHLWKVEVMLVLICLTWVCLRNVKLLGGEARMNATLRALLK